MRDWKEIEYICSQTRDKREAYCSQMPEERLDPGVLDIIRSDAACALVAEGLRVYRQRAEAAEFLKQRFEQENLGLRELVQKLHASNLEQISRLVAEGLRVYRQRAEAAEFLKQRFEQENLGLRELVQKLHASNLEQISRGLEAKIGALKAQATRLRGEIYDLSAQREERDREVVYRVVARALLAEGAFSVKKLRRAVSKLNKTGLDDE